MFFRVIKIENESCNPLSKLKMFPEIWHWMAGEFWLKFYSNSEWHIWHVLLSASLQCILVQARYDEITKCDSTALIFWKNCLCGKYRNSTYWFSRVVVTASQAYRNHGSDWLIIQQDTFWCTENCCFGK